MIVSVAHGLGERTHRWTSAHGTAVRTVVCAVAAGVCLTAYALLTGRSPEEAALSGQTTLGQLAENPHGWSVLALVALVLCKALAWGISLGSLRGGPIFPAVLLGVATGLACAGLPGLRTAPRSRWASRRRRPSSPGCRSPAASWPYCCSAATPTTRCR